MTTDTLRTARYLVQQDRTRGLAALNDLFRSGTVPDPPLDGRYVGELVALDMAPGLTQMANAIAHLWMPWQGKIFHAARSRGSNIFTRDSFPLANITWPLYRGYVGDGSETYRAFMFRTWTGPGLFDTDRQVLKIDYDLEGNPNRTVRRVLDELVQLKDGRYLGKAHMHWLWGKWQTVAYFSLTPESQQQTFDFDPIQLGYYEKAGWEAYYDRNWPRAFWLLVLLNREQFHMSWPLAVAAALDTVRASIAFAPQDNDVPKARHYVGQFYHKAHRSAHLAADPATVAELEMTYWLVHRELAERRKQQPDDNEIEPMVEALTQLHVAIFGTSPERMRHSAELRAQAAVAVDRITGKRSTDVAADWREVERYLQQAYQAVQVAQRAEKP